MLQVLELSSSILQRQAQFIRLALHTRDTDGRILELVNTGMLGLHGLELLSRAEDSGEEASQIDGDGYGVHMHVARECCEVMLNFEDGVSCRLCIVFSRLPLLPRRHPFALLRSGTAMMHEPSASSSLPYQNIHAFNPRHDNHMLLFVERRERLCSPLRTMMLVAVLFLMAGIIQSTVMLHHLLVGDPLPL